MSSIPAGDGTDWADAGLAGLSWPEPGQFLSTELINTGPERPAADVGSQILRLIDILLEGDCTPGRRALLELTRVELLDCNDPDEASRRARAYSHARCVESLSGREIEILVLLSRAMSAKSIARLLHVSPGTIKWHTRNIYSKLGARSREQALSHARARRILV
jgi:LuxR family transcriptional regulator, maltose regulon positive regulatory protein